MFTDNKKLVDDKGIYDIGFEKIAGTLLFVVSVFNINEEPYKSWLDKIIKKNYCDGVHANILYMNIQTSHPPLYHIEKFESLNEAKLYFKMDDPITMFRKQLNAIMYNGLKNNEFKYDLRFLKIYDNTVYHDCLELNFWPCSQTIKN